MNVALATIGAHDSRAGSALAHHVLLKIDDHLDQPAPGIFESDAGAREVVAFAVLILLVTALLRRRRRRRQIGRRRGGGGGSRNAATCALRLATSSLQARDLLFQRGAVFRHRLAGPADGVRTAERDLPGLIVEAQEAVIDAVEGETARRGFATGRLRPARSAAAWAVAGDGCAPARRGCGPSCASAGDAAHASTAAMASVKFRMAISSDSAAGTDKPTTRAPAA